jgi:hypothetical protein
LRRLAGLVLAALLAAPAPRAGAEEPAAIEVRVLRAGGAGAGSPAAGARAAAARVEGDGPFDPDAILGAGAASADRAGLVRLRVPAGAGRILVAAAAEGCAPALAWVPAGGGVLDLPLPAGAPLVLAVRAPVPPKEEGSPSSRVAVEGARVRLVLSAGFAPEGAPAAVRTARTDAEGRARVPDLPRGPFLDAEVRAPGYAPARSAHLLAGGVEQEILLEPAARIAGRVLRVPGGAPFAGARVRAGDAETVAAADGSFALDALPGGVFAVEAAAEGTVALDRPVVRAEAGRTVPVPDLRLALLGGVRVLVRDAEGRPVPRVPLRLLPADGAPAIAGPPAAALTGSDGRALLAPAAPGTGHRVVVDPPARLAPRVSAAFAVLPGETVDLGAIRLDAGGVLEGEVLGPDGLPVEGATLTLVEGETDPLRAAADPAAGGPLRQEVAIPGSGRFRIDRVAAGSWTLLARAPGRLPAVATRVRVDVGRSSGGIRLELRQGLAVAGTVAGPDGAPVVDALLVALAPPVDREAGRARSGPGGAFRIEGLPPGEHRIRVVLPEESFPDPLRPEFPAVAPGEGLEIRLPARASVEGTVVDPGGGPVRAEVAVLRVGPGPADGPILEVAREVDRIRAAEDGSFATRPLPEGRWRLRAESPDGRSAVADVAVGPEGAGPVALRLAAGTTVRGVVVTGDAVRDPRQVSLRLLLGGRAASSVPPSAVEEGGAFAIHGVPPGEHDLVVSVPGLAPVTLRSILVPAEGGVVDLGPILLGRGATLRLRLLGESRAPLADAPCAVVDGSGLRREERANASGFAIFGGLAAGAHLVEVRLPSGVVLRRPAEIPSDGETEETLDLGLDAPGLVEVRRAGGPVPGAAVRVLDAVRGAGAYAASVEVVADDQGRARVPGLPDGAVLVEVAPPGEPPVRLSRVAANGRLAILLPEDGVEGEVRAAEDGRPIPGAVVRAWSLEAPTGEVAEVFRGRGVAATADGRGRFRFPSLPAGRWLLEATAPGRGAIRRTEVRVLRGGGAVLVEFLMEAAARVRGRVRESSGGPAPGAVVEATDPATGDLRPGGRRTADASGLYDFDGLAPGPVVLTARAGGLGASPPEFLNLAAGEERALDLDLWPGGTLEVAVVAAGGVAVPDAEVEVRDFFGTPVPPPEAPGGVGAPLVGAGRTGPDGRLRIPGLRAGVYLVRARREDAEGGVREAEVRVRVDARHGARTAVVL